MWGKIIDRIGAWTTRSLTEIEKLFFFITGIPLLSLVVISLFLPINKMLLELLLLLFDGLGGGRLGCWPVCSSSISCVDVRMRLLELLIFNGLIFILVLGLGTASDQSFVFGLSFKLSSVCTKLVISLFTSCTLKLS